MGTGQQFAKALRPAGCVAVLVLAIIVTAIMFTAKGTPVEGYEPPEDSKYYSQHPDELLTEVETNLLPKVDAQGVTLWLEGGVIIVTGPTDKLHTAKLAIIHYYNEELFEFREAAQ